MSGVTESVSTNTVLNFVLFLSFRRRRQPSDAWQFSISNTYLTYLNKQQKKKEIVMLKHMTLKGIQKRPFKNVL